MTDTAQFGKENTNLRSGSERILVVDDQEGMRVLLKRMLEKSGYSVTMAASGEACLKFLDSERFGILLLDIIMPEMDGMAVLAEVRKRYSREELPVIMVTVKSDPADIESALRTGANDYLIKPLDFNHLLQLIGNYLSPDRVNLPGK